MNKFINKYGRKLLTIITVALIFISFHDYFSQFSEGKRSAMLFPSFFMASSITLLYVIPILYLIFYLVKRLNISKDIVLISFILGFTLPLFLASEGNSLISLFLFSMGVSHEILNNWGAALTAPFTEEISKGAVVFLIYFLFKKISLKETFIVGLISGFGFQVLEDIAYIFQSTFGNTNSGYSIAFERVSNAFGSHITFGIVFGIGLIALINKNSGISKLKAFFFIISPITIHFIWNSPLEGNWVSPLFGSINLILAYCAFKTVDRLNENSNKC